MTLKQIPLDALHRELGARMVPFAGYEMPVQYPAGIIREHQHTRAAASLFDVSHMGQLVLRGEGAAEMLEGLVPADLQGLGLHRQTYTLLTNERGGIRDDLIVTRWAGGSFFLVVNAACKAADIDYICAHLQGQTLEILEQQALLALQGPAAREVLARLCPDVATLPFLHGLEADIGGVRVYITCSGYTGEDGFELSLPASAAEAFARTLLDMPEVAPAGLGARDSLRLEAGLCLYGHELNEDIDPVQAGLLWAISKVRRPGGERPGGFPGAEAIFARIQQRPPLCRVGLAVAGKRPVREGQPVQGPDGQVVGEVCSGGFGPTVGAPIAMAYIPRELAEPGTELTVDVRGTSQPVTVARLPFVPQRYFRG